MDCQTHYLLETTYFIQSKFDHSLFIKKNSSSFIVLFVFVDDIILVRDCLSNIYVVKPFLNNTFKIKNLVHLKYLLGLEIA